MNEFKVRQAENGWIVSRHIGHGRISPEYVFSSLDEMNAWLKDQFEGDNKVKEQAKHG